MNWLRKHSSKTVAPTAMLAILVFQLPSSSCCCERISQLGGLNKVCEQATASLCCRPRPCDRVPGLAGKASVPSTQIPCACPSGCCPSGCCDNPRQLAIGDCQFDETHESSAAKSHDSPPAVDSPHSPAFLADTAVLIAVSGAERCVWLCRYLL